MSFYLCEVTFLNDSYYYGQPVAGSEVETNLFPAHNRSDAVNIYLARNLASINPGEILNGLAYKLRAVGPVDAGIIIKGADSKTIAHELGHYFLLLHTFDFTSRQNPNILLLLPDHSYNHYSDPDFTYCQC